MQNQIGLVNTAGQCFAARFHIQRGAERPGGDCWGEQVRSIQSGCADQFFKSRKAVIYGQL